MTNGLFLINITIINRNYLFYLYIFVVQKCIIVTARVSIVKSQPTKNKQHLKKVKWSKLHDLLLSMNMCKNWILSKCDFKLGFLKVLISPYV